MKPPIEFRPARKPTVIAKLKAKVEKFNAPLRQSKNPSPPILVEAHRLHAPKSISIELGSVNRFWPSDAHEELARRRALKAAQMRRHRAKQKEKK